jgi:hypothetical protein
MRHAWRALVREAARDERRQARPLGRLMTQLRRLFVRSATT